MKASKDDLTDAGLHQRYRDTRLKGGTVAVTETVCPVCNGKLSRVKRTISSRDLTTRIKTTEVIEIARCRKCGWSFNIESDVQPGISGNEIRR